jgi:hypothetical protein
VAGVGSKRNEPVQDHDIGLMPKTRRWNCGLVGFLYEGVFVNPFERGEIGPEKNRRHPAIERVMDSFG